MAKLALTLEVNLDNQGDVDLMNKLNGVLDEAIAVVDSKTEPEPETAEVGPMMEPSKSSPKPSAKSKKAPAKKKATPKSQPKKTAKELTDEAMKAVEETPVEPVNDVTEDEIRKLAMDAWRNTENQAKIKEMITEEFGAARLSDVQPKDYNALSLRLKEFAKDV